MESSKGHMFTHQGFHFAAINFLSSYHSWILAFYKRLLSIYYAPASVSSLSGGGTCSITNKHGAFWSCLRRGPPCRLQSVGAGATARGEGGGVWPQRRPRALSRWLIPVSGLQGVLSQQPWPHPTSYPADNANQRSRSPLAGRRSGWRGPVLSVPLPTQRASLCAGGTPAALPPRVQPPLFPRPPCAEPCGKWSLESLDLTLL